MFRVTSIAGEPSMLVYALAPAFYIALTSFLTKNKILLNTWQSVTIITCMLLTYSTIGYTGILLSLLLILLWNYKKIILKKIFIFIVLSFCLFYLGSNGITYRIKDSFKVMRYQNQSLYVNISTYSLLLHSKIAIESLKKHILFGTGLGSYLQTFNKYYQKYHYDASIPLLHKGDGASLLIRISVEMGLFGIFILLFFIFKNYIFPYIYRERWKN